jgi:hypothetical protein
VHLGHLIWTSTADRLIRAAPSRPAPPSASRLLGVSTDGPEAAYQAAEAGPRAYYAKMTRKYRNEVGDGERPGSAATPPAWTWAENDQKTLNEFRDKAADTALALLQARGWFRRADGEP